ncbi:MAG TPA: hypothetical protein VLX61_00480 [Anaerolineales bacterium]|nr:hypothetical protein [Anaerolineales bacterium]
MAKVGRRYPLLVYTHMIDRWWPALLLLGLALASLAWPFYQDPFMRLAEAWRWQAMLSLGGAVTLLSLVMASFRKSGYVQLFGDHLRLVTPFLRMNISYRRILRTSTISMAATFPLKSMSSWRRDIIRPLSSLTAVKIELNAFPIPLSVLRFFLSPFFFKDSTPHIIILVNDWMGLSTELDSLRVSGNAPEQKTPDQSILSRLPRK